MSEQSPVALIKQAQNGDRLAFATLVRDYYGLIFKTAWHYCGNRDDAQDIAQDACIKLANHLDSFKFESAFTTWLYRLVLNTAKDQLRSRARRTNHEEPLFEDAVYTATDPSPEQQLAQKDILKAVARLSDDLKNSVILCYWQGLSHREAATILGCSEGTVSWRLHEARKKIGIDFEEKKGGRSHG